MRADRDHDEFSATTVRIPYPLVLAISMLTTLVLLQERSTVGAERGHTPSTIIRGNMGEVFSISLPVQLGWGGRWFLTGAPDCCVRFVREDFEPPQRPAVEGSEQHQRFYFEGIKAGTVQLTFEKRRPFLPDEPPADIWHYTIYIQ